MPGSKEGKTFKELVAHVKSLIRIKRTYMTNVFQQKEAIYKVAIKLAQIKVAISRKTIEFPGCTQVFANSNLLRAIMTANSSQRDIVTTYIRHLSQLLPFNDYTMAVNCPQMMAKKVQESNSQMREFRGTIENNLSLSQVFRISTANIEPCPSIRLKSKSMLERMQVLAELGAST